MWWIYISCVALIVGLSSIIKGVREYNGGNPDGATCYTNNHCTSGFCHPDRDVCYTPIATGQQCTDSFKCTSQNCVDGTCTLKDDGEWCKTGAECGSTFCGSFGGGGSRCYHKAPPGVNCVANGQCLSNNCKGKKCQQFPTFHLFEHTLGTSYWDALKEKMGAGSFCMIYSVNVLLTYTGFLGHVVYVQIDFCRDVS